MTNDSNYLAASFALAQLQPKLRVTYGSMRAMRGGKAAMVVALPAGKVAETKPGTGLIRLADGERLRAEHLATIAECVRAGGHAVVVADRLAEVYKAFEDMLAATHGEQVLAERTA